MSVRIDPEVAAAEMRAAGVEPLEGYTNSGSPWRSVCLTCDNEVSPQLSSIRYGNEACRYCAHKGPRGSRVDTEVARHEFAEAGVEMIGNFDGVATPTLCRCLKCGNEVPPRLNSLRNGNGACLICSGKAPVDAEVAREEFAEAGVEMISDLVNTKTPTLCRCMTCGSGVSPKLGKVRQGRGGVEFVQGTSQSTLRLPAKSSLKLGLR